MRTIERLLHKAKQYTEQGAGRSMGFICRNYGDGGDWRGRITKLIKGETAFVERTFETLTEAEQWAEKQLHDGETLIIDNI